MDRGAVWAVAVPLLLFKVWFAILLLTYAPTRDGIIWIAITHWPLVIIVGVLIAGPGIAGARLLRARARREQLRRAEWMIDADRESQCSLWDTVSRLEGGD
jgi:hypothetical protein